MSWLFDWSKLRMFTFQTLLAIPCLWLNLVKNIKRFNFSNILVEHSFHKSAILVISHLLCLYQFESKINENIISKNTNIDTSNPWNFISKLTLTARANCVYIGRPIRPLKRLWEIYWHLVEHSKAWSSLSLEYYQKHIPIILRSRFHAQNHNISTNNVIMSFLWLPYKPYEHCELYEHLQTW